MARARITQVLSADELDSGRDRIDTVITFVNAGQPSFVANLLGRTRSVSLARRIRDTSRYGDIRGQDLSSGSITTIKIKDAAITNAKINDLSADKITTGTLDAGAVTVASDDGKMTLSGNILQIKNGADVIQITIGKYDGTNYGIAFGSTPGTPNLLINGTSFQVNTSGYISLKSGSDATWQNSGNTLSSVIGYVINNFCIIGDSTNGINLYGNGGNISLGETSGSYGGGSKVVFIPNRSVAPTTNPTAGGILYADGGALKWRGSGGTVTTIAVA